MPTILNGRVSKLVVFLLSLSFAVSFANGETWRRIGTDEVGRRSESDSMSVNKQHNFRYIRLRVLNAGVIVEKWILEFRDGTSQHVGFTGLAAEGIQSPPIPVRAKLKKIRFRYYSAPGPKKARIEVEGME